MYTRLSIVFSFLACLVTLSTAEFEYEAVYEITEAAETHSLNLQYVAGGESQMKFIFVKTDEGTAHGIEEAESIAETAELTTATTINPNAAAVNLVIGDVDTSGSTSTHYNAVLDSDNPWLSVFNIKFPSNGYYALYCEHAVSEFEITGGTEIALLKDGEGHDLTPLYYVGQPTTDDKSSKDGWRDTMLGCLIVWAVTLSGVVMFAINLETYDKLKGYVMMFASGTLLSTAFALVLFDAVELINNPSNEGLAAGRWTAMIMTGFITTPVIRLLMTVAFPQYMVITENSDVETKGLELTDTEADVNNDVVTVDLGTSGEEEEGKVNTEGPLTCRDTDVAIFIPLILGDFFHNFTDGIFIGTAFKCNVSFAWKIVGITVAHEVPQEISDFVILTKKLNYSTLGAFAYNALSGASVMLGGLTIMATDTSSLAQGMLLAYGAGNYLYVATMHLFEDIGSHDIPKQCYKMLAFCIGVVAIGLILLDHEHCEVSTTTSSHAGHGH